MGETNTSRKLSIVPKLHISPTDPCPCGTGLTYAGCCYPLHRGESTAPTAEKLMRSRYSAFAVHDIDYLLSSWHPSTRPNNLSLDEDVTWTRLIINETVQGQLFDTTGIVEFTALFTVTDPTSGAVARHRQHERSSFSRVDGRWVYVDGEL